MGVELFQTNVEFDAVASKLSIGLDDSTGASRLIFAMTATTGGAPVGRELAVSLSDADGLSAVSFSYDGLDRTYTLTVDLNDTVDGKKFGERIDANGIAGASFNANANLSSLKVVLRPRAPGGDWTSDHPSFALIACWEIDGRATESWEEPERPVEVNVEATIEVCVGLSVVVPNDLDLALPNFQVRLDLPSIGLATKWVPLSWFEWPDLMPLKMEGLLAWFSGLLDFDWAQLPEVPLPRLPQWDVDLPLSIDLPLGVGVVSTHLHLRKAAGQGLVVDASAEGFYVTWQGEAVTAPRGQVVLRYVEATGIYTIEVRFFEAQYPEADAIPPWQPYGFSLPFDLLGLEAECWYLRLGLFLSNVGGGKRYACFEALLEIGGLKVTSRFTGDESEGLYRTDVRLLLRDTTLVSAALTPGDAPEFLVDAKRPASENPFDRWLSRPVPALSFADDLLAPPPASGVNEYGLTFHDGEFRSGERAFLLWRMNGRRLLKALAHDLLGREAAGAVGAPEEMTDFGLEIATQGSGSQQIRLDWRPVAGGTDGAPDTGAPAASEDKCLEIKGAKDIAFNVPFASPGTYLVGSFADPLTLDLPAISLEMARPRTQSIVLRVEPDGSHSASHLLLFDGTPQAPQEQPVPPLARARIGFSLKQSGYAGDERDVVETQPGESAEPFLAIGLGRAQAGELAVRTVGWRRGRAPRFLEVLPAEAAPIRSLIPTNLPNVPGTDRGCPGTKPAPLPPAALDFDAFETPRFGKDSWRLSARIAATNALFKMFGDAGDAGQKVSFTIDEICIDEQDDRVVLLKTSLTFALDAFTASGAVTFRFDLRDLSLSMADGASLKFRLPKQGGNPPAWTAEAPLPEKATGYDFSEERPLLGLRMTALARKEEGDDLETIDVLTLSIKGGRFVLALPADRWIVLRYTGLGRGSLNFWITEFVLGPGGLDATGNLISNALRVKGLKNPFILEQATLRIRSSRLDYLSVSGSGVLPELLDEAPVKIAIAFKQGNDGRIDIDSLDAQLGDKDKPIFSRGTRFKFEIQQLGLAYRSAPDGGERHFFFELTGSAQFTPQSNEFTSGLLENLKSARLDFVRVPLTDEFAEHISLSIELKRPIVFKVFGVFRMEIRSIGFHPKFPKFSAPTAAIIIGGQVEFADTGDVIRAEIDFHAMYIGLPKPDSSVPQVYFDGLRVDISTSEGFRIGGRVDTYKSDVLDGFAGEGTVQIPGFPELSAAFAFVRVRETPDQPWLRAWFIAIEAAKIGYLVGGALPIYLRQVGLGFGYRYTLPLILELEKHKELSALINAMLREVGKHKTLARIDSWKPETRGRRWTIALEAVLSLGSANSSPFEYNEKAERKIRTIFTQIFAAYRSDFTLVAAAKLWFPVSVDDFFRNAENMRERPLASGFFAFSAPQNRLLAHVRKNQDPYLGEDPNQPIPYPLKLALEKSYFESTLLIEPGLVHAELGWPDRLCFDLTVGPMRVGCRAGILIRIERDLLIYGYYFSAYGELNLGGGVDFGFVGVRVEAQVRVQYATRLLIGANLRKPLESNIYGAIGLDIAVRFLVRAWLRLNFRFFKISIDISFSFSLQLSVLGEIGWAGNGELGFRGRAQFIIGVFGRSLAIKIDVGVNKGAVEQAKSVLSQYAGSFLEPGKAPPAMPGIDDGLGGGRFDTAFAKAGGPLLGVAAVSPEAVEPELPPDCFVTAQIVGENRASDGDKLFFAWIMPGPNGERFYPTKFEEDSDEGWHGYATLVMPDVNIEQVFVAKRGSWAKASKRTKLEVRPSASIRLEAEGEGRDLTLEQLIAGCYVPDLSDLSQQEAEEFPLNWPTVRPRLTTPGKIAAGTRLHDARVFDPNNAARGPRRMLDKGNAFDRAVLASIEMRDVGSRSLFASAEGGDEGPANGRKDQKYLNEQALANQSLLLQGFYDDLTRIARTTRFNKTGLDSLPETPSLGEGRPTLFDLGVLICVKAKEMPDWLARRDRAHPILEIASHISDMETHALKPAAEAACIDFALNPPVVHEAAGYFDEEIVALAWRLDWGGTPPVVGKQLADGSSGEIEDFLRTYEIQILDFNTQRCIHAVTSKPCDVLSETNAEDVRLVRYGYSVAREEILPVEAAAAGRTLIATVTPISQAGTRGAPFSFTLELTPVMTPLPADDAHLDLRYAEAAWTASMRWRQPMLPQATGIARTVGWQLILRSLADVPLGAYPEEAIDVTERGLMSTTGQALIEGDIIVPLVLGKKDAPFTCVEAPVETEPTDPDDNLVEGVDDLPPAEKILAFNFVPPKSGATAAPYFDHKGRRLLPGSVLYQAADGFFRRLSADKNGGRSWRLFLRAVTHADAVKQDAKSLREVPVSGLSPVRLAMSIRAETNPRPVPYFEWPAVVASDPKVAVVAQRDLGADADLLHVPVVGDGGEIRFVPKPGRERAVTVTWNAMPAGEAGDVAMPLAAVAAYSVYETILDGLINFDLAALSRRPKPLRRIVPTDAARARLHPTTMADTQNWEAQYPVFARTRAHLQTEGVAAEDMLDRWPGTYSWADSELDWPDKLTPAQRAELVKHPKLGKLLDLGEAFARAPVHPYLALLFARLHDLEDGLTAALQVEVALGPPTAIADPVKWLDANSDLIDPYGWAGLTALGLAAAFALREPVTGILVDQGEVLHRLGDARKRLLALFDEAASDAPAELLGALDRLRKVAGRHVMTELPIQHPQAYRAGTDSARAADVGLAIVQVSLRPVPWQIAHYDIIRVGEAKAEGKLTLKGQVNVVFAGVDRPPISGDRDQELDATLFKPDETLLVREFMGKGKGFRQLLREFFKISSGPRETSMLAKVPAARFVFGKLPNRLDLTPFGRFEPLPGKQEQREADVPPGYSLDRYKAWIAYLVEAFARPAPGDDAPDARDKAIERLTGELLANNGLFDSYRIWGARLFATAPIQSLIDRRGAEAIAGDGLALAMAATQPKSVEPVQISADGQGRLRLTRFVKEEWATARSYSVTWEGRYDRLVKAIERKAAWEDKDKAKEEALDLEPPLPAAAARRDVFLPRVRALEPPVILSARSLRAADGRPFNEIVVAHSELRLAESNTEVAAKLEFGDLRRRYQREFAEPDYIRLLKDTSFANGDPLLDGVAVSRAATVEGDWDAWPQPPDLSEHDETLLFVAPTARWGATRYQDAAEPFYYRQTVTVEATAARRLMTQGHSVVVPFGDPDTLTPLGPEHSDDLPAASSPLNWNLFWTPTGWEAVWTDDMRKARADRFVDWSAQIALPEQLKQAVIGLMRPSGYRVRARLPRYAESLSAELRAGPFAHELVVRAQGAPAGLLPDAGARLTIADLAPGQTFAPIAQVVPLTRPPAGEEGIVPPWAKAFKITALSSDFETAGADINRVQGSNWSRGLFAKIDIRPAFAAAVSEDFDSLPPLAEIEKLVGPEFDKVIAVNELPKSGALARLTPLAIRLIIPKRDEVSDAITLGLASPLAAPRWAFRPALDPASLSAQAPAGEIDLAIGLRLLLDTDRRHAAALASWDALASPGANNGLLELIEQAAFATVLVRGVANESDIVKQLLKLGFEIFERVVKDGVGSWQKVVGDIASETSWKVALVRQYSSELTVEIVDAEWTRLYDRPAHAPGKQRLGEAIGRLVGQAYRPTAMREPQVFAERGNEARVPWRGEANS
ncbi:hypothetical protein [Mesorhizobium sp. M0199]|uniref:hypothetical protein n=1 Tax=Mesorhizobium sp. M0199 TaxID=2956911 RepID=UPI0033384267